MRRPRADILEDLRSPRLVLMACGVWWAFFCAGAFIGAGRGMLAAMRVGALPALALLFCLLLTRLHPLTGGWFLTLTGVAVIAASPFLEFRLATVLPSEAIVLAISLPLIFCGLLFVQVVRNTRAVAVRRDVRPARALEEFRFAGRG